MTTTSSRIPTHTIAVADGRTIAVDETGPADGPAVVFLHSAPGSRRFDPDPAATRAAGVRLITVDRPGYGASSPWPDDALPALDVLADDVARVLDHLDVREASVSGWSTGGLVALGVGARHPERVRHLALVGTPAPDDDVPWVGDEYRAQLREMRTHPESAFGIMAEVFAPMAVEPEHALGTFTGGDADARDLAADTDGRVRAMNAEAFATGASGAAADIVAVQVAPWGFDPRAVGAPVELFYGEDDVLITPAHGRYWQDTLADGRLHLVPDAGHLVVMKAWADVLAALAGD
jgi:pimeloyl-ACP methyl ester carboxylesterase